MVMSHKWSGERLETFIHSRDTIEHLHRYAIASEYVKDKVVLDIACGEGYGSNLMSERASFVYSVDIDDETIKAAKLKYVKKNIEFITGSASSIPFKDNSINVVVSFETIEHHDEHNEMLEEIKRVLKPDGLLIISSPDKLFYSDKRNFNNKFHLKELYKEEFRDLIEFFFSNVQLITQKYFNSNSILQDEKEQDEIKLFSGSYSEIHTNEIDPLYLVIIASDIGFVQQKASIFNGSSITNMHIENRINYIYRSSSYRIGHFILSPIKFIKRLLK